MLKVRAEKLGDVTVLQLRGRIVIGAAIETLSEVVRAQTRFPSSSRQTCRFGLRSFD
jgi:hypothetical protein